MVHLFLLCIRAYCAFVHVLILYIFVLHLHNCAHVQWQPVCFVAAPFGKHGGVSAGGQVLAPTKTAGGSSGIAGPSAEGSTIVCVTCQSDPAHESGMYVTHMHACAM